MIRVVLDTNIIVSALLQPLGPPAQVFLLAIEGSAQICISGRVYAEYEEVIRRPRLRLNEDTITKALHAIECAHAARADFVVTGNIKDFPTSWLNTRIITARRFLEVLSNVGHSDS